jgi:hypothetical protein
VTGRQFSPTTAVSSIIKLTATQYAWNIVRKFHI